MHENRVDNYEERLNNLPQVDPSIANEIKKYEELIDDQNSEIAIQEIKIKALESELLKLDKEVEKTENQINELSSTQEKNINKEKKYLMQIDNYNHKIDNGKTEITRLQKSIALLKKDIKTIQSTTSTVRSQKNKIEKVLTKEQIKINSFTQTLNDLKFKIMEQGQPAGSKSKVDATTDIQKEEKQISELFNAIKKQMSLIDVLKRQKVHLIASTVFKHCQEDFEKVLEMNNQK